MSGWVAWGVYLAGYVALWRTVVFGLASDFGGRRTKIKGEDVIFGAAMGSIVTLFWPFIAVGIALRKVYAFRGQDINSFIVPRSQRRRIALDERERHIKSLERELGIK